MGKYEIGDRVLVDGIPATIESSFYIYEEVWYTLKARGKGIIPFEFEAKEDEIEGKVGG